jgi:cysteine desulfurase
MTISSSKIYGPKGVGCLYVSKKVKINPIIFGGGQENGLRSGTENTVSIAGFSGALCLSDKKRKSESERLTKLREYFISKITKNIDNLSINGGMKNRLPNNINVSIRGVEGESLVLLLDSFGISCSTGSACSSMDLNPSHVLIKIGVSLDLAHCSVRFTLGRYTRKDDIDYTLGVLTECVKKIRGMSSVK